MAKDLSAIISSLKSCVSQLEACSGEEEKEPMEDDSMEEESSESEPAPKSFGKSGAGKKDILAGILSKKIK